MALWKAPLALGAFTKRNSVGAISGGGGGGGAAESPPKLGRRASSRTFEQDMDETNSTLRMDLLLHEWEENAPRLREALAAMKQALAGVPRSNPASAVGAERESIAGELENAPAQLERLATLLKGFGKTGAPPDELAAAWEQYRALSLKLTRLPVRLEELANGTFAAAVSPANSVASKGSKARGATTPSKGGRA